MIVHLHTLCWNDAPMLDFFFRHYEPWVDRFFIYDDGSTDGTLERLKAHPKVQVEPLVHSDPDSWVLSARQIYDTSWRRSRGLADWVVVTNIDEHLFHPDMAGYLAGCAARGITAIPALGYQMISETFPSPDAVLARDCPFGAPWDRMSKMGIFRPDEILETNFGPGRHRAEFVGRLSLPEHDEVLNLHYKYLGVDYVHDRHGCLNGRLGKTDRVNHWGHKYAWDRTKLGVDFNAVLDARVDVRTVDHRTGYPGPHWWRQPVAGA